jgi:hypothetical protein
LPIFNGITRNRRLVSAGLLATISKGVLAVAVIPVLVALYYGRATKKGNAAKRTDWSVNNSFFWILLVAVGGAIYLEVGTYRPEPILTDRPLEFFPLSAYKAELDSFSSSQQSQSWQADKEQLLRKFDYACYAWKTGDFDEAAKALVALETGQDQVGNFRKISSFAVSNNLGCVAFRQHRNKEFKAFLYFETAKDRVQESEPFRTTIDANLTALDQMVNKLD